MIVRRAWMAPTTSVGRTDHLPYGMTEVNALPLFHDLDEPLEQRLQPGDKVQRSKLRERAIEEASR